MADLPHYPVDSLGSGRSRGGDLLTGTGLLARAGLLAGAIVTARQLLRRWAVPGKDEGGSGDTGHEPLIQQQTSRL